MSISRPRTYVLNLGLFMVLINLSSVPLPVNSQCKKGCDLALASFYVWRGTDLTEISRFFSIPTKQEIMDYNNRQNIPNENSVIAGTRINIPFRCDCLNDVDFLGHVFQYKVDSGDTYGRIVSNYSNLTSVDMLRRFNSRYPENNIPNGVNLNVVVNCSCGNSDVSEDFGLFVTYPLRPEENLTYVTSTTNVSVELIRRYNLGLDDKIRAGEGTIYIPGRDKNGNFPPLPTSTGLSGGAKAGIAIGTIGVVLLLAGLVYVGCYRNKAQKVSLLASEDHLHQYGHGPQGSTAVKAADSGRLADGNSPGLSGITVGKSVEFTYEELATATNDFSIANKIGQGGFGAVYYAELRGEKAAIKKMDMEATREFLAELKVLTNVHHLNLVRLIGYCVEGSLFLVYEYVDNGHIGQHLRGTGRDPLPWSKRVQIALDSARGLEYIHEHTVPVYIHRDIKTANILIDKNFHAKVADFGLTKLTEVGSSSLQTRLVGTFGYMPPEYAQYGDVSPKVDVYAFGVVLYELISAKEAIVKPNGSLTESKGLVALFEEVLYQPDPDEDLHKLVDPRLGDDYPLDSVRKMAQLAKACTHENPLIRPSMRSIVVALMTLSSSTEDWDVGSFYGNQGAVLNRFLPGILANEEATKRTLQDDISQNIEEIQKIIGYNFNDQNLLRQAFTHPSYHKDCTSYEQLEYMGDSVLNYMITNEQFFKYPNLPAGLLTPLRAANVDTEKLARAAVKHSFHKYLRHGKPILTRRIQSFINVLPEYPLHSHGLINAPKVLADVVESTIGAVFVDSNCSIDTTWEVAKTLLEPIITLEMLQTNPVKKLYETCQKHKLEVRVVDMWSHDGSFEVFVDNQIRGKGMCHVKKEIALNRAANKAYNEVIGMLSAGNMNI